MPSANKSGKPLRTLSQGESVLVIVEGSWARLGDGTFVEANQLSAKPIARPKTNRKWQQP
jgi:hypothetical protein